VIDESVFKFIDFVFDNHVKISEGFMSDKGFV
jgi:hypothetical protein